MSGGGLMVNVLKKCQAGIVATMFWLFNAAMAVYVTLRSGLYLGLLGSPSAGEDAQLSPWPDILLAWFVCALATVVVYLILRKVRYKATWLVLYAMLLLAVVAVTIPTDYMGAFGVMFFLPFSTLLLAWLLRVWVLLSSAWMRRGRAG